MTRRWLGSFPLWVALPRIALFAALTATLMLLAACGALPAASETPTTRTVIQATATPLPLPTSVTVARFSPQDNRVLPFQQTTHDAAKAQQLYHALNLLPDTVPSISCPLYALGMGYELSFMRGDILVRQVILQTCLGVSISNAPDCRQWTPALTAQIAATLGVPTATIAPIDKLMNTAGPNGPFAQPAPTPPRLMPIRCQWSPDYSR